MREPNRPANTAFKVVLKRLSYTAYKPLRIYSAPPVISPHKIPREVVYDLRAYERQFTVIFFFLKDILKEENVHGLVLHSAFSVYYLVTLI